jgi:hypothetical protein
MSSWFHIPGVLALAGQPGRLLQPDVLHSSLSLNCKLAMAGQPGLLLQPDISWLHLPTVHCRLALAEKENRYCSLI